MLDIKTIVVTPYQQNARILMDNNTKEAVIIDPGGDSSNILAQLPSNATLKAIWITHSHIDHVSGVVDILNHFMSSNVDVIAHAEDEFNRENLALQSQMMQFPYSGDFNISQSCDHDDILSVGSFEFRVLYTPGHAIGHVSFFCKEIDNDFKTPILIAGDALFKGSIGRTDLPGGDHRQLLSSISTHLFTLPLETTVCSGHGPDTTIGEERISNPFFN